MEHRGTPIFTDPKHFEQASKLVRAEDVAKEIVCGPDPQKHIEKIQEYIDAGFENVYVHQVDPDQQGFFFSFIKKRSCRT